MAKGKSRAGAKSKYETCVKPYLDEINRKVRNGVIEEEIAKALNISVATLNNYKKQHPEFAEALSKDKGKDVLQKLINAGIEQACGYYKEETTETTTIVAGSDKKQLPLKGQRVTTKKWFPPNPTLNIYYTKIYGKEEGFTGDPLKLDLEKEKFDFEKAKQGIKDFFDY